MFNMKLNDFNLDNTRQYYFSRDYFVRAFNRNAPSFIDYMWEQGSHFQTDSFIMFRSEDEFYILHFDTGIMINWYKHLGRTNTCNRDISKKVFKEFLMLLEEEVKVKIEYDKKRNRQ